MSKKQLSKKTIVVLAVMGVIALISGVVLLVSNKNQDHSEPEVEQETRARRLNEPVNEIPVLERLHVNIEPLADGNHLNITIHQLNKDADQVEYEIEYQAGTMLQGAMGELEIKELPLSEEIFLGSCSAGGACTYHEDISSGNLFLKFIGEDNYALKTNWRYFDNAAKETKIASSDAKFQLESDHLASTRYLVVHHSPGIPEGLEELLENELGSQLQEAEIEAEVETRAEANAKTEAETGSSSLELISDPYTVSSSSSLSGTGQVLIRLSEDSKTAKIAGFDGTSWTLFDTNLDGKEVRAEVKLMKLYVVIK